MLHIPKLCLIDLLINTFIAVLLTKSSISMPNYLKAIIIIIVFFKRHKPKKHFLLSVICFRVQRYTKNPT